MLGMRLSARADYALRAAIELASATDSHVTADRIARAQQIPGKSRNSTAPLNLSILSAAYCGCVVANAMPASSRAKVMARAGSSGESLIRTRWKASQVEAYPVISA